MKFKILHTEEELNKFRHVTEKYINVLLPLEYLKRSRVVAYSRSDGVYCAGMVFVKKRPFRVLEQIPESAPNMLPVSEDYVFEITGLWLDEKLTDNKFASLFFSLKLYKEFLLRGKKGCVYAYSLKKRNLQKLYANAKPEVLFSGQTKLLDGMEFPELETVEFISRKNLILWPFRKPKMFIRRVKIIIDKQFRARRKIILIK